jgi:hypothetical protein
LEPDWRNFEHTYYDLQKQGYLTLAHDKLNMRYTGKTPVEAITVTLENATGIREAANNVKWQTVKIPAGPPLKQFSYMDGKQGQWLAFFKSLLEPPFNPKFQVGDIVAEPNTKTEYRVLAIDSSLDGKEWFYTTEPIDEKLKAFWGIGHSDLEGYHFQLVARVMPEKKSAADLLAQEALQELAEDALRELRGL